LSACGVALKSVSLNAQIKGLMPRKGMAIPAIATDVANVNCRSRRTNAEGFATLRWVGIDEAGYGPNLGPMVMTAVVAESTTTRADDAAAVRTLDFWGGLAKSVTLIGSGSTIRRQFITVGRGATGSRWPAWPYCTRREDHFRAACGR
jgi:hypothetical protein